MELNIHSRKIQLRLISSVNKTVTKYLSDLKERMVEYWLRVSANLKTYSERRSYGRPDYYWQWSREQGFT